MAFPIGLAIVILSLTGLVTLIILSINGIKNLTDNSEKLLQYETLLTPVVMFDPNPFDDVTKAKAEQLIDIAVWSVLRSVEIEPDKYSYEEGYLVVPQDDVKAKLVELFGNDAQITLQTVEGYGYQFVYDSAAGVYQIPITGVAPIYTPDVVSVTNKANTVVLIVGYLPSEQWKQDENGDMQAPSANKYMKVTLRKSGESYYISAIQATDAPANAGQTK